MKAILVAALTAAALATVAHARPTPPACPTVAETAPDMVSAKATFTIVALVDGGDPGVTPTYNWAVSAGAI